MVKKKGSKILKSEAEAIALKLQATIETKTKHDVAKIYHGDNLIAHFGIRRGNDSPHSYIPRQLRISEKDALGLARCTVSRDQFLALRRPGPNNLN